MSDARWNEVVEDVTDAILHFSMAIRMHEQQFLTMWPQRRRVRPNFLDVRASKFGKSRQHAMKTRLPRGPRPSEVVEGCRVATVWTAPGGNQFAASGPIVYYVAHQGVHPVDRVDRVTLPPFYHIVASFT